MSVSIGTIRTQRPGPAGNISASCSGLSWGVGVGWGIRTMCPGSGGRLLGAGASQHSIQLASEAKGRAGAPPHNLPHAPRLSLPGYTQLLILRDPRASRRHSGLQLNPTGQQEWGHIPASSQNLGLVLPLRGDSEGSLRFPAPRVTGQGRSARPRPPSTLQRRPCVVAGSQLRVVNHLFGPIFLPSLDCKLLGTELSRTFLGLSQPRPPCGLPAKHLWPRRWPTPPYASIHQVLPPPRPHPGECGSQGQHKGRTPNPIQHPHQLKNFSFFR